MKLYRDLSHAHHDDDDWQAAPRWLNTQPLELSLQNASLQREGTSRSKVEAAGEAVQNAGIADRTDASLFFGVSAWWKCAARCFGRNWERKTRKAFPVRLFIYGTFSSVFAVPVFVSDIFHTLYIWTWPVCARLRGFLVPVKRTFSLHKLCTEIQFCNHVSANSHDFVSWKSKSCMTSGELFHVQCEHGPAGRLGLSVHAHKMYKCSACVPASTAVSREARLLKKTHFWPPGRFLWALKGQWNHSLHPNPCDFADLPFQQERPRMSVDGHILRFSDSALVDGTCFAPSHKFCPCQFLHQKLLSAHLQES